MSAWKELYRLLFDRPPKNIIKKLLAFPESGMGYTIVAIKTKQGQIVRRIGIGDGPLGIGYSAKLLENPDAELPFRLRDVVDVEWEGYRSGQTTERPEPAREEWTFSSPSDRINVTPHHPPQWLLECTACGTIFPLPVKSMACKCGNISFDTAGMPTIKDEKTARSFNKSKS